MQNSKLKILVGLFITLAVSNAVAGKMRDSIGKLIPGVYMISTGTHYVQNVPVEIFNDRTFRLRLKPGGEMTAVKQDLLLSGRIIENKSSAESIAFQSFELKVDRIYQVQDFYSGLWHPQLEKTTLTELPLATLDGVEFSLNLDAWSRARGLVTQDTALLETRMEGVEHPPTEIVIFLTRNFVPTPYRSVNPAWYGRFDKLLAPPLSAGFKSCEGMFRPTL